MTKSAQDRGSIQPHVGLTARQVIALDIARESEGYLVRYSGGFWGAQGGPPHRWEAGKNYVGTPTITALMRLGVAQVIKSRGAYAVLVRVKEPYRSEPNVQDNRPEAVLSPKGPSSSRG